MIISGNIEMNNRPREEDTISLFIYDTNNKLVEKRP